LRNPYLPPDVIDVKVQDGRKVWIEYANGLAGVVDVSPLLAGAIFDRVRNDDDLFREVAIDPMGTICWPDGADIAPERLYEAVVSTATA